MKVTVVLCSCNGEAYIREQVESLIRQIDTPDELLVCDDASEDATVELLRVLSAEIPFPLSIHQNTRRIGVGENYADAIGMAPDGVIALCDQDDVWLPGKLAAFGAAFEEGADWVCCDARVVDAELNSLGYTLWERMGFTTRERTIAREDGFFEVLLRRYVVAGATLAFRTELRDVLLPIPPDWHYDAWLAVVLAATGKGRIVDAPMQDYRQHDTNVIGGVRREILSEARAALALDRAAYYRKEITRWSQLAERLISVGASAENRNLLDEKIAHLKRRAALPRRRLTRIPAIAAEIRKGGYRRFARNWGHVALDLLGR